MKTDWRALPPPPALRAYVAVAEHGSLSQAARALNVTHPAIAQQVRALEEALNLRLVRRQGRGMALTPEGAFGCRVKRRLHNHRQRRGRSCAQIRLTVLCGYP